MQVQPTTSTQKHQKVPSTNFFGTEKKIQAKIVIPSLCIVFRNFQKHQRVPLRIFFRTVSDTPSMASSSFYARKMGSADLKLFSARLTLLIVVA